MENIGLSIDFKETPLKVLNSFFIRSNISFTPSSLNTIDNNMADLVSPEDYNVGTQITQDPNDAKIIQIGVWLDTKADKNDGKLVSIDIASIGVYQWELETPPSKEELKLVYSWAVAVQMGAIRQHVLEKTSGGPYAVPIHIPILLVRTVETADEQEKIS